MSQQTQGPAIYFDGVTGAPRSVTLTLGDSALAIASAQETPVRWDYSAIEHLSAPDHRLRLALAKSASTARIEVRDPDFAKAAKIRLGFLTQQVEASERRQRHRVVEWSIAAVVAVMLVGAVGMPSIAELMLPLVPLSADVQLGAMAHQNEKAGFSEKGPFECGGEGEKERAGQAAFLKMVNRLEAAAGLPVSLHPFVIRTKNINAVAYPGGYVHVLNGIIQYTQSPDELAGVIAHELGHVSYRHGTRGVLHRAGLYFMFGMVLGDVIGSGGLIYAAQEVLANRNSRSQEAQADAFSARLMNGIGADSHALANMFERMMKAGGQSRYPLLLRDHPTDADRVAAIRATPRPQNPAPTLTAQEWQALKQICSGS
jgi:Zn-dependent protease with chaperone function